MSDKEETSDWRNWSASSVISKEELEDPKTMKAEWIKGQVAKFKEAERALRRKVRLDTEEEDGD